MRRKGERELPNDAASAVKVNPTGHYLTTNDITVIVKRDAEHVEQVIARRITVNKNFFFHAITYVVKLQLRKSAKGACENAF